MLSLCMREQVVFVCLVELCDKLHSKDTRRVLTSLGSKLFLQDSCKILFVHCGNDI